MKEIRDGKLLASVKVGPKGQITIPAEARRMFNIREGDTLIVLGDINRGLALMKADELYNIMGGIQTDEGNKDN